MSARPSRWVMAVHAHSLATGLGITPDQAVAAFGMPPTLISAGELLQAARRDGWFRLEQQPEPGAFGRIKQQSFVAIKRVDLPAPIRPDTRSSYFTGISRVNSVFQLGDSR